MMPDNTFLKYLISEDIYLIEDQSELVPTTKEVESVSTPQPYVENQSTDQVSEPMDSYVAKNPILILFSGQVTDEMPYVEIEFLSKILGAVKCSLDQVDIRPNAMPIPLHKYQKVVSFTTDYKFSQKVKYSMYNEGNTKVLLADTLSVIMTTQELKKSLWGVLQQMF